MNWITPTLVLLAAFLAVFAQASVELPRRVLGAQVDLLPVLMVYAALTAGPGTIAMLAVLGGLLFDSLSANPAGISVLPLLGMGFFIHQKRALILRQEMFAQWVLGIFACTVTPLLSLLLLLAAGESPLLGWASLWHWLVLGLGGGILTPLCFKILDETKAAITYPLAKPNPFRENREIKRGRV